MAGDLARAPLEPLTVDEPAPGPIAPEDQEAFFTAPADIDGLIQFDFGEPAVRRDRED